MQWLCQVAIARQIPSDATERWLTFEEKGSKIFFFSIEKIWRLPGSSIRIEQEPLTLV
jgi:hypothetical protein